MNKNYIIAILVVIIAVLVVAVVAFNFYGNDTANVTQNVSQNSSSSLKFGDITIPDNFKLIESDDDDAKYQSTNDSSIFLKVERCDSLADAKDKMDDISTQKDNLYNYVDTGDDLGCKEIVQVGNTYYYIKVYSTDFSQSQNTVFDKAFSILDSLNQLNKLTPLAI